MSDLGNNAPGNEPGNEPGNNAPATGNDPATTPATDVDSVDHWKARAREWENRAKGNSSAEKERDELRARLEKFENESKSEAEKARDQAVREAEERVRNEMSQATNERLVKASVRVAAAGKLADAEDAVRFLDLGSFKVNNEGEVDDKAIASAIDSLIKEKPYLAAKATKPHGDIDQGARGGGGDEKVTPGVGRLSRAYANNTK